MSRLRLVPRKREPIPEGWLILVGWLLLAGLGVAAWFLVNGPGCALLNNTCAP